MPCFMLVNSNEIFHLNDCCKTYLIEAGPDFIEVVMLRDQETKKGYLKLKRFIRLSVNDLVIRLV